MQDTASTSPRHIRIEATDGSGSFNGYLAVPRSGSGPGLVLAQEIFGVNQTMRDVADYYAEEGYVVLVPDLFWRQQPDVELGYSPDDWQRAFALYKGFDEARGMEDMQASITALRGRSEVQDAKVGVLGFCLGGKLAYLAACRTDADAAVGYYGVGIDAALDEADRIRCRLALHVAELDGFCPPEARERIVAALRGRPNVEVHVYPGVDHAFARVGGEHYHRASALMAPASGNKAAMDPANRSLVDFMSCPLLLMTAPAGEAIRVPARASANQPPERLHEVALASA